MQFALLCRNADALLSERSDRDNEKDHVEPLEDATSKVENVSRQRAGLREQPPIAAAKKVHASLGCLPPIAAAKKVHVSLGCLPRRDRRTVRL